MHVWMLRNYWKLQRVTSIAQRFIFQADRGAPALLQQHHNKVAFNLYACAVRNSSLPRVDTKDRAANFETLLGKLLSHYQIYGHINIEHFVALLDCLETQPNTYNQLLSPEQADFLLGSCGTHLPTVRPSDRLRLFHRLWHYLAQHCQLNAKHFRTQLQVLQHNRASMPDYRSFLQEISKFETNALQSSELYAELLNTACSSGNMRQATEVLAEMRSRNFALTNQNFNALILGHARNRDLSACQTVLDNMTAANVQISTETQTALFQAYVENASPAKAVDVLRKFQGQFDDSQILRMLRTTLETDVDEATVSQLVRELPTELVVGADVPLNLKNLCIELLSTGKLQTIMSIIYALPTQSFNENQDIDRFGVFLLHELFRAQVETPQIIEFAQMLEESGKNTRALHVVIDIATRRSPPIALPFFEVLVKKEPLRPHYFWPLMMYNFRLNGEAGILRTLKRMQQFQVVCDRETLVEYVLPRLSLLLDNPVQSLQQLDAVGLKTSISITPILTHLISQQKIDEVQQLLSLYPTKLDLDVLVGPLNNMSINVRATKRYQQFARVLAALVQKSSNPKDDFIGKLLVAMVSTQWRLRNDLKALFRFISEIQKHGLTLSNTAVDLIIASLQPQNTKGNELVDTQKICRVLENMRNRAISLPNTNEGGSGASSSFIKHPRDMSLDELECHLIELESKRLNARGVLRRLLQLCVRENRLSRALEIKAKCDELHVQISPGMMASILDLYVKLKDLPNAELSLKRLKQSFPGFQIDEHKIIDYAALLVHNGDLDAGKELLQERASSQKIIGGDYVLKNIWNFLTNVALLAATRTPDLPTERNLTRETFSFLQQLGYCGSNNAILGPIVREYLLRGNLEAAVDEFSKMSSKFRHTPLQFELLSLLVRLSNANELDCKKYAATVDGAQRLLGVVTSVITKVHGAINMNSALLLAFAESGTDNQLRRLLMNPEFRINQQFLLKNCEHLGNEGAVQTLLRLARGARGLNRIIDEQSLYAMLLSKFTEANDFQGALSLYECLEADDDLKISQEFLRTLVNLLKINNIDIPSGIALRAQVI